eukprot:9673413-Lingulodinium_polyedra.AAC.1
MPPTKHLAPNASDAVQPPITPPPPGGPHAVVAQPQARRSTPRPVPGDRASAAKNSGTAGA